MEQFCIVSIKIMLSKTTELRTNLASAYLCILGVKMEEIWKDIKGYEGLYQVSNLGNVKSLKTNKILKKIQGQYYNVGLYNNRIKKHIKIHRLVAETFLSNPNNYDCINHKDENKYNNNVNNLEWCTRKYNNNYGTRLNKISKSLINNPKICKKVNQYDKNHNFIKQWESTMEIERKLGIKNTHISDCCLKKEHYKTAGGYIWEYEEGE
jgi:hypothetical protein